MKKYSIVLSITFAAAALVIITVLLVDLLSAPEFPRVETEQVSQSGKALTAVCDIDYEPYSFYAADGSMSGYDVEMLNIIANELDIRINIKFMTWSECLNAINSGEADIVTGINALSPTPGIIYSIALCNDPYICFGKKPYQSVNQLYDKKLCTIEESGAEDTFIQIYGLGSKVSYYPTYSEALRSVVNGSNDYAIVRYSVGRRLVAAIGNDEVRAQGTNLANDPNCYAVHETETQLLQQINDTILTMKMNGAEQKLEDKWLGQYVRQIGLGDLISTNFNIMLYFLLFVFIVLFFIQIIFYLRTHRRSVTDSLTGFYNKASIEGRIEEILENNRLTNDNHALLIIDIDDFKRVNDSFGHAVGDLVLKEVAARIQSIFRRSDFYGRFGGDEFVVFLENIPDSVWLQSRLNRLNESVTNIIPTEDGGINITISIGAAVYPEAGDSFNKLFKNADKALYKVKKENKNGSSIISGDFL